MLSLNVRLHWVKTLTALNVTANHHSLPTTANCPYCVDGRLRLIDDLLQGGAWAHCTKCEFAGDIFDLCKSKFPGDDETVFDSLDEQHLISRSSGKPRLLESRRRFYRRVLWARRWFDPVFQGNQTFGNNRSGQLFEKLSLPLPRSLSNDWISSGVTKLMMYVDREKMIADLRDRETPAAKLFGKADRRKLPDSDAVAVPFYDVPGRIASVSLLSVNRGGSLCRDEFMIHNRPSDTEESGLAYHPGVFRRTEHNHLVITDNLHAYLTTQTKHMTSNRLPLPLVCCRTGVAGTQSWQVLAGKTPVLWQSRVLTEHMALAIKLDAKIAGVGPRSATWAEYLHKRDTGVLFSSIIKKAQHWTRVCIRAAVEKNRDDGMEWFAGLALTPEEQQRVFDACTPEEAKRVHELLDNSLPCQRIPFKQGFVLQRPGGWYYRDLKHRETLITSAPFRVLEVSTQADDQKILSIEANYRGQSLIFSHPKKSFAKDPFGIVENRLIENGIGMPSYDDSFKQVGLQIAVQFHEPETVVSLQHVGRNQAKDRFDLPAFSIARKTGEICFRQYVNQSLPGARIQSPDYNKPIVRELFTDPAVSAIMPLYAAMLAQILSVSYDNRRLRIVLSDQMDTQVVKSLVRACDGVLTRHTTFDKIINGIRAHDWFYAINVERTLPANTVRDLLTADVSGAPLIRVNEAQLLYTMLRRDAVIVSFGTGARLPQHQLNALAHMLPDIVSWVARDNQANRIERTEDVYAETCKLIDRYMIEQGFETDHAKRFIDQAELTGTGPKSLAKAVASISVGSPLHQYLINWKQSVITMDDQLGIDRRAFLSALKQFGSPLLDLVDVDRLVCCDGSPVEVRHMRGRQYWMLPAAWVTQQRIRKLFSQQAKILYAAG